MLLSLWCKVLLSKLQCLRSLALAYQLYQALLLQVEEKRLLLLQELWVHVIDTLYGCVYVASVHCFPDLHAICDGCKVHTW